MLIHCFLSIPTHVLFYNHWDNAWWIYSVAPCLKDKLFLPLKALCCFSVFVTYADCSLIICIALHDPVVNSVDRFACIMRC